MKKKVLEEGTTVELNLFQWVAWKLKFFFWSKYYTFKRFCRTFYRLLNYKKYFIEIEPNDKFLNITIYPSVPDPLKVTSYDPTEVLMKFLKDISADMQEIGDRDEPKYTKGSDVGFIIPNVGSLWTKTNLTIVRNDAQLSAYL